MNDLTIQKVERVLSRSFYQVMAILKKEDEKYLQHYNESVFRYLLIQTMIKDSQDFNLEDEWHRIDLLLYRAC